MDQANFREILKHSCLEVYDVPEGTTRETLIACFQGYGVNAHLVTQDIPKWLILLQNPNVAEKFVQDTENSPLSVAGQALSVKPCSMPCDIPPEWEQFLKQPVGQSLPVAQGMPHDRSSQSEPYLAFSPQSNVTESQGQFQPQHGMAYPHPSVPYRQQMGKHVRGPQPQDYFYPGQHIEPYASGGRQSYPLQYPYPGQQLQYPGQYTSHPPNMPPQVTGYPYPDVGFQPMGYPNMPPTHHSQRQKEEIKGCPSKQRRKQKIAESDSESDDSDKEDSSSQNKIKVTDLTTKITESKLKAFFKNRKKSGGGTIESIDYQTDRAVVTFQDPAVVDRILQKLPLLLEGKQINVERYASDSEEEDSEEDDSSDNEIEGQKCSCTIEVRGMAKQTSRDTLEFYFESKKAAGVRLEFLNFDFNEEERRACIQYTSEEDMRKVLGREHKIDGVKLEVKEYIPPKPRPLYEDKVLLKGVNPTTTKDGLTNFLEAKANAEPTDIVYGEDDDAVIVSFAEPPDFEKLTKACKTKAIDGCYLQMQRVPISNCIKVSGIGETGKDTLEFYFENTKRSGGGEIEKIDYQPEDDVCFIYFKDHKVVDKVCSKQHTIDNNRLSVKMYNETIGEVSDGDGPKLKVPEPITMANIKERQMKFLLFSKTAREMLKHSLSQKYTVITFPEEYTGNINLACVLTKDVNECKKLSKTWKKDTTKALEEFIDKLTVENIDVLQDAWDKMNITDANNISDSDEVLVLSEDLKHEIYVIGFSHQVHTKVKELREKLQEIEEDLDRKKKQVNESTDLKPYQLLLLKKQRYIENMEEIYKGMKVSADKKNHRIIFEGLSGEVITAKLTMFGIINGLVSSSISPFSDGLYQLLKDSKVKRYILEKMTNENISAVWDMDQGTMKVYAMDDENAVKAAHILKESLVETKVSVTEDSRFLLPTKAWDDKVTDIQQNNVEHTAEIICDPVGGIVVVYTTDIDKGSVLEMIHTFLDENTILEKTLKLKVGVNKFLQQKQKQIEDIASSLRNDHVKIQMNNTGIVIKGTALGLGKASQKMNAIIQKVIKKKHTINKPGITSLMKSEIGLDKLEKVKRQTNVEILPDEFEDDVDEGCGQQSGEVVQEMVRCDKSQFRIMVMLGDITELNADVLVNTANENLKHRGGLAKTIVEKGGEEIQVECDNFIKRKRKPLRKGELFCSKPGNLQCKMIAHAVCPSWQGGQKNEEEDLTDLVIECMERSNERGHTSIAIPPLGAGTFNIPIKVSARVMVKAVDEYFDNDPHSTVKDIFLCDVDRKHVEVLIKALRRHFGDDQVTTTSNTADDQQWSSACMSKRSYAPRHIRRDSTDLDFEMPTESDFDGNIKIELVKGEIAKQKADIIVNTAGQDLQLHNGAVSNSLLTAAGQGLQEECTKQYPNGISQDEIAVTEGHRLMCQNVCHGSLPQWDGGATALVGLQNFMTKCLQEASDRSLQTVAFPALGTGNLGYPRDLVAKEMYRIVSQFAGSNLKSTLNEVFFVVFHKDDETVKAFEEAKKSRNVVPNTFSPDMKPKSIESRKKGRHSFESKSIERSDSVDADEVILEIGKLNLKIYEGDLTIADVDAIVNTTNAEFDMHRGAVANAIRTKGGAELEKQIKSNKKVMKRKGIAITTGGDLKCQSIVHINTEDRKQPWKMKILNVLQEAEDNDSITSIAFPVLGTGLAGGPTVEESAKYIFEALMEFQEATAADSLQEIHIVIFQSDMFQRFLAATEKCFKSYKGGKQKGFFRQITDMITGNQKGDLKWNPQIRKVTLEPSSYPIVIFSDDIDNIEEAITRLESILEDAYTTKSFKDEIIKEFSDIQKKAVKKLGEELNIEVVIEKRLGRIKLRGLQENVMKATDKVHDLIRKEEKRKHSQKEEELIADMVTWCYIEVTSTGQDIEEYPAKVNRILEMAYRQQEKEASFTDNYGDIFLVDLDAFEEYKEDAPADRVKVIRRNKMEDSGSDIPSHWTSMKDTENLTAVILQPSDKEYQTVVAEFQKTIGTQKNITQVQRIQNRALYQQYTAKKKWMEKQNPKGTKNELSLWHGTAPDAIDSINAHGFNRSYCGKNATAFGNGVYFAVESRYSAQDQYSHVDATGKKRMYLCKVLTGEFTQGKNGFRVPPQKPNAPAHILYDSVVDTPANPKMYIIFNDTQAYPEYLLTFDK